MIEQYTEQRVARDLAYAVGRVVSFHHEGHLVSGELHRIEWSHMNYFEVTLWRLGRYRAYQVAGEHTVTVGPS